MARETNSLNLEGNGKVNKLAEEGASTFFIGPKPLRGLGKYTLKEKCKP